MAYSVRSGARDGSSSMHPALANCRAVGWTITPGAALVTNPRPARGASRSLTSLIEKLLTDYLQKNGYMKSRER